MTRHIMLVFSVLLSLSLAAMARGQLMSCPQVCSCIWRNGKQTTICENQNLISIPNQISPSTQVLDLNTNNFQILPSKAFQERGLINLQKLFLPRCKLGAIADDAFVQLTNLVELDLSDNLLTQIPVRALANATNLRRLLLNNNHIATIAAESFSSLNNLKFLNLSGCQTHTIEARAFFGLRELEYLYLHSNHLTSLSQAVVSDLPALYSFDLHRNPWLCNCEMRATREWMLRNNVGQSIPPTCEQPMRLAGLMWNSLDLDDFACEPDILTTTVEVSRTVGSNATLSCTAKGHPEPRVYWFMESGFYRNISSFGPNGKYLLSEEVSEGMVHSTLTIVNLDQSDDARPYICSAENRAGIKTKNFTVMVLPASAFGVSANWSKVELAGAIVAILTTLVLVFVLVTLLLIRSKRFHFGEKKMEGQSGDANSVDKTGGPVYTTNTNYPYGSSLQQHLSMLGLDGIDKKPEIFLNTSQVKNELSGPPPDLVTASNGTLVGHGTGGFELNTYTNNGMTYAYSEQNESQLVGEGQYGEAHYITGHYSLADSMFPPNYQPPPPPTGLDADGLYRAVMVAPGVIANTAAITHTTNVASVSPPPFQLSAANLYSQYRTQSSYDLRSGALFDTDRISPDSVSNLHRRSMQPTPILHNTYDISPQQQQSQPLMYSNPGFVNASTGNIAPTEPQQLVLYEQEAMESYPSKSNHVFMNDSSIYGVKASPLIMYSKPAVFYQPSAAAGQPIYGVSVKPPPAQRSFTPNPVAHLTPTPTGIAAAVRYSPDEGYAEESSTGVSVGNLEGTEV